MVLLLPRVPQHQCSRQGVSVSPPPLLVRESFGPITDPRVRDIESHLLEDCPNCYHILRRLSRDTFRFDLWQLDRRGCGPFGLDILYHLVAFKQLSLSQLDGSSYSFSMGTGNDIRRVLILYWFSPGEVNLSEDEERLWRATCHYILISCLRV
jgi:hypothetical protein